MVKKKILILSANPTDTTRLHLSQEVREIQTGLQRAIKRERFEIITEWAVQVEDLQHALLDHSPQIVHFSGHGSENDGLALENNSGELQYVSTQPLVKLFEFFKDKIECVLLNACYSESQAQAIYQNINCVIGMRTAIGDCSAIKFAVGFYDALGAGRSYQEAFNFGLTNLSFSNISESLIPQILIRNDSKYPSEKAFSSQELEKDIEQYLTSHLSKRYKLLEKVCGSIKALVYKARDNYL
ncbi:MAG: CHAT domain-containing protein, partial [Rhizonema sp. PD37]|nr:CHAT domain-containing protein [Rhizonema sp. PD37]